MAWEVIDSNPIGYDTVEKKIFDHILHPKGYPMSAEMIATFVSSKRKALKITQPQLADKAGVGLRFLRELEAGKATLRMDKVNDVLRLFGHELGPVPSARNTPENANG